MPTKIRNLATNMSTTAMTTACNIPLPPALRLMVNFCGKSFLVVVNFDATIKDAKAEISRVFSSIWPTAMDTCSSCSVGELCFGGYALCDDYCVGVLLHDMAKLEAYREGESHEATVQDPSSHSSPFAMCTPQLSMASMQGMSTPYMGRGSISSGYPLMDAHQSPSLQSPNITSSLAPEQRQGSNATRLLGSSLSLTSKSSRGSLSNSETGTNSFIEASKNSERTCDKSGNGVHSNTSTATPHDSHNPLSDVSISPSIHVTPPVTSESSSCAKPSVDTKSKKYLRKRRITGEERSKKKSKLMAKRSGARIESFRRYSELLTSSGSSHNKLSHKVGVNRTEETTTDQGVSGQQQLNSSSHWTTSDSENDVLAEETASQESESLLAHADELKSMSPPSSKDSSTVVKDKKINSTEDEVMIITENESEKQVISTIEKSQEDSDIAITIKSAEASPCTSDCEREPTCIKSTETVQPLVPSNNTADDTIDQDVVIVKETQDETSEGAETDCRPVTPEIPLQGNVPGSIPKETDKTETRSDSFELLLSGTESVVTVNEPTGASLTDASEVSTSKKSNVEKKKHKRKNKKTKSALNEVVEKVSVTDVNVSHGSTAASLTAQGGTSKSSKKKEKKSKRKRDERESEIDTPVASKRMKLQNSNEESIEPVPIVCVDRQTGVEQTVGSSSVLTDESETPLPKKRRRKTNTKYADNLMDTDFTFASPVRTPKKKSASSEVTSKKTKLDAWIANKLQNSEESVVPETQQEVVAENLKSPSEAATAPTKSPLPMVTDVDEGATSTNKKDESDIGHLSPAKKKGSGESTQSASKDKVTSTPQHPPLQPGKSAAIDKLLADVKNINTVKYLRSLCDVLLKASSTESSDGQKTANSTKQQVSEGKQTSNNDVSSGVESSAGEKTSSLIVSSPKRGVKPPPKASHSSLSLSSKLSFPAKSTKRTKKYSPNIKTPPITDTALAESKKKQTPVVVPSPLQNESSAKTVKQAYKKEPTSNASVASSMLSKSKEQESKQPMKNSDDDSESEITSDSSLSTSEDDEKEPNQELPIRKTSLVALLDDHGSKKQTAQRSTISTSSSASRLVQAQESFSSVFSSPLPVRKQHTTSNPTHIAKADVKAVGTSGKSRKKKNIKNLSLSQQEEELCNSQNLTQLLDNEQLWASDHSDS